MAAPLLYHEKQVSLLCGVHALNALLQGPYFSAHDLGTIAQEFDEKERQLMASAGVESADFLRYMAEDSGNAAANGNFSIQVLTRALEAWDLRCVPALSSSAGSAWREPQRERAFLCNLDQHWFAVRRCDARSATVHREGEAHAECNWWNFNSVFPAPQPISELYLAAFLAQLKDEGYAIFVVRGHLPPRFPDADAAASGDAAGEYGMWVSADDAAALNKRAEEIKNAGRARNAAESALAKIGAAGRTTLSVVGGALGVGGGGSRAPTGGGGGTDEDAELQAAIAASLGRAPPGVREGSSADPSSSSAAAGSAPDADLAAALAASLAGTRPPRDPDPDLDAAIAASLAEESGSRETLARHSVPPEPSASDPEALVLAIRAPDGRRVARRFRRSDRVGAVAAFAAAATGADMARHALATAHPDRLRLADENQTLEDAGVKDKSIVAVEPR